MFAAVRLTLSFLTPKERVTYYSLIGGRALTGLLDVFGIALIGFIASVAATKLEAENPSAAPVIAGIQLPTVDGEGLVWLVVFVLAVFTVKALIAITLMRAQAHFVATVETRNVRNIVDFLLRGSLSSAKRYSKAEFQFAVTGSTTYAFTGLMNNLASLVTEGFLLFVITATFVVVDPVTALFALVYFAVVVLIIQVFIGHSLKRAGEEAVAGTVETINSLSDTLDAFREISVLHKQATFIDRIDHSRSRIARSGATMAFLAGMPRYVVETALILGVVFLVAQQFFSGQLATGLVTVGVFLAGGVRMMASLLPLQSALSNIKQNSEQAAASLDLLGQIRDRDATVLTQDAAPVSGSVPDGTNGLDLRIDDVIFRYAGNETDTIHGVNLHVEAGQYVAIIGPSGAGKTTIVDLILGLISPAAGKVTIGGTEPTVLRSAAPGLIAYVPQKPGLVSGTIAENIALGVEPEDIDHQSLADAVDSAHLRDYINTLPLGLNTSVGKQVDSLSGGQIQRIGVARALYCRPRLIVLDEATSGLDAGSEAFIASSLRELHGSVTVIVIAHRLSTVQHANVVHVVEDGRIIASGDFASVVAEVPMVAEYVKLMSFDRDSTDTDRDLPNRDSQSSDSTAGGDD